MLKRIAAVTALLMLAIVNTGGFRGGPGASFTLAPPDSGSAVPSDEALTWIDPVTRAVFVYSVQETLWLSPAPLMVFGKNAAAVTGLLNINATAMVCDTTTLSADGYAYPESLIVLGASYRSSWNLGIAASNCTTQVFLNTTAGPTLQGKSVWTAEAADFPVFRYFAGPNEVWTTALKPAAAPVNPTNPIVTCRAYRFRRPS